MKWLMYKVMLAALVAVALMAPALGAPDGSVPWPNSFRDTVTADDGSVTWLSVDYGHVLEPTAESVDPVCFRYSVSGILLASVFIVRKTCLKYISGLPGGGISIPHQALKKRQLGGKNAKL
jgi:hypothetical protein